jgi:hypothetical protein
MWSSTRRERVVMRRKWGCVKSEDRPLFDPFLAKPWFSNRQLSTGFGTVLTPGLSLFRLRTENLIHFSLIER